ncbi:hypothetical protein CY35_07G107900 [Sphagnum magellanicum]|uniref:Uncharacterized protein n=2 Tax=Sphagnum magellanicum TaxID=128215 RepID=A0ACB8HQ42_9BRYO|nr:hypothetical protein CY35_07G107900 [Sphagnum magellanicum]KAH9557881.1 hypothetical protein CY35_07G107900 [Sphagnum magellanicum]
MQEDCASTAPGHGDSGSANMFFSLAGPRTGPSGTEDWYIAFEEAAATDQSSSNNYHSSSSQPSARFASPSRNGQPWQNSNYSDYQENGNVSQCIPGRAAPPPPPSAYRC